MTQRSTALEKYQDFLQHDLLPVSHGDFRLGAENFRKKLLYDEMVDIPLDHLLEIGYADLHRNQQRLKEVAAQIDPTHTPREVLGDLQKDHPAPDQLLQAFRDVLGGLKAVHRAAPHHHDSLAKCCPSSKRRRRFSVR